MNRRTLALSALSGLLLAASFPTINLHFLAWFGLLPLFAALKGRSVVEALRLRFSTGIVFFAGTVYWVTNSVHFYGHIPLVPASFIALLLCAYCALFPALFSAAVAYVWQNRPSLVVIAAPAVWTALQEKSALEGLRYYNDWDSDYSKQQSTRPQTVGYGLTDSPAGQAAWIIEKFWSWMDSDGHPENVVTRDELLDNVMLYWLPATAASSARRIGRASTRPSHGGIRSPFPSGAPSFPRRSFAPPNAWPRSASRTLCTSTNWTRAAILPRLNNLSCICARCAPASGGCDNSRGDWKKEGPIPSVFIGSSRTTEPNDTRTYPSTSGMEGHTQALLRGVHLGGRGQPERLRDPLGEIAQLTD